MKYNLPKCPEVCTDCEAGHHIAHFMDELGEITITLKWKLNKEGKKCGHVFQINGYAEAGDLFWLSRILRTTANNIEVQESKDESAEK